jgi:S1-C subfamily serine protease
VLIVNRVLPWSTSIRSGVEEGDIVWGINGQFIGNNLLRMSQILDENTDKRIEVDVYRNGVALKAKT